MRLIAYSVIALSFSIITCVSDKHVIRRKTFAQIGKKLGLTVKEYDIVTQDGYKLKLFQIPGDRQRPVLLMHGIIDSSDTFILRENGSLAVALANAGYDVWLGNNRGNRYSRRHIYLDPDRDKEFWDFSFHEIGYYDLPITIDFILEQTQQKSLAAIGHSQGNTIFLVLGALRPEYNSKIKVLLAVSPICFLSNLKGAAFLLMNSVYISNDFLTLIGQEEFAGDDTSLIQIYRALCGSMKSYPLCAYGFFFPIAGRDPDEFEPEFMAKLVAYYPTGTSKKNAFHVAQIGINETFAEFDHSSRNMDIYNSSVPPEYNLSQVSMKVALLAGRNDNLSTLRDVDLLNKKLPNVVEYRVMEYSNFNHIDGVWGRNMDKYLFPHIFHVLKTYR